MIDNQRHAVWPNPDARAPFDVIAIAASFGGLRALSHLLGSLPADFPAPIVVVQHLAPQFSSALAAILDGRTPLCVDWAEQGARLSPGRVYVAPPDQHVLLASPSGLILSRGQKVNWTRPAADVLFKSVASMSKDRAIGVVLTGYGRDGAAGAGAIKRAGGRIIVQDPASCVATPMPAAAIRSRSVDFVLPLERIAPALISLCMVPGAASLFAVAPDATAHLPYQP
jgi:two-component system chemotaxis response regulator CheB